MRILTSVLCARLLTTVCWLLAAAAAPAQQTLLVHLPSAPVESAASQAEAVAVLTDYLSRELPEVTLEAEIFRHPQDAIAYLAENSEAVALTLSDAAMVSDFAADAGLEPYRRFSRQGAPTYRRLVVVRSDRDELQKLVDLRDLSLAVVETTASAGVAFLHRQVFEGAIEPGSWFGTIAPVDDDFAATASVLYGQTDAALIAEYNPLLTQHLGGELRVVYESPPLSLPVLSLRASVFGTELRRALDRALEGIAEDPRAGSALADLGIDGFTAVSGRSSLLAEISSSPQKAFEIALPQDGTVTLEPPPTLAPEQLPWTLAVELPELELDPASIEGPRADEPRE